MNTIKAIDVCIVCYRSDVTQLQRLLQSIREAAPGVARHVSIWDNSVDEEASAAIRTTLQAFAEDFSSLRCEVSEGNLGFGQGNNALARQARSPGCCC